MKFVILKNENPYDHLNWKKACISKKVDYQVIDITKNNWLQEVLQVDPDYILARPSDKISLYRELYIERIDILVNELKFKVFPSYDELKLYENKRYFAYWLEANKLPYPKTSIFYSKKEANEFSVNCEYPVVAKLNIGASGNGVKILKTHRDLLRYINKAFMQGVSASTGPKFKYGNIIKRIAQKLINPVALLNKIKTYKAISEDKQKGFIIIQEYIPHDFEWRVVKIGESFFAHKKLKKAEKASGSLLKNYDTPPLQLLDFVKDITDMFKFNSVAIDLFDPCDGGYLINEIQCIFGQSDPYQMLINDIPGRYVRKNNEWIFEAGDFNKNESFNLRLEYIINESSCN